MEHKYSKRAKEILDEQDILEFLKLDEGMDEEVIEAMCQLADEVEAAKMLNTVTKEDIDKLSEFYENCIGMYTKEQVEELLEKQRELCANEAKMTGIAYGNDKSISDYEVNKDSILNANLKLE